MRIELCERPRTTEIHPGLFIVEVELSREQLLQALDQLVEDLDERARQRVIRKAKGYVE